MLKALPPAHQVAFHHEVYNEAGDLLVKAKVELFFMEAKGMKRTNCPEALRQKLEPFFEENTGADNLNESAPTGQ